MVSISSSVLQLYQVLPGHHILAFGRQPSIAMMMDSIPLMLTIVLDLLQHLMRLLVYHIHIYIIIFIHITQIKKKDQVRYTVQISGANKYSLKSQLQIQIQIRKKFFEIRHRIIPFVEYHERICGPVIIQCDLSLYVCTFCLI